MLETRFDSVLGLKFWGVGTLHFLGHIIRGLPMNRLVGLVVKASASGAEGPVFKSRLRRDFSGVESYQCLKNWLGLVGTVSVYCDWVRQKV